MSADPAPTPHEVVAGELVAPGVGPRPPVVEPPYDRRREQIAGAWLLGFRSVNTEEAFRRDLQQYFDWADTYGVDALRAQRVHIDGYVRHLADRRLAASTIVRKLTALTLWYRYACATHPEVVTENPAVQVQRPAVERGSPTEALTLDEVGRLVRAADARAVASRADGLLAAALVRVLLGTAVRVSELCGAHTWDVVDGPDGRVLLVTRKGRRGDGEIRRGKKARVALPATAGAALDRYLAGRSGPLFAVHGQRMNRRQVDYLLNTLAREAGLIPPRRRRGEPRPDHPPRRIGPHVLRHTAAEIARRHGQGIDVYAVQQLLGHTQLATTELYLHGYGDLLRSAAHQVSNLVEQAAAQTTTIGTRSAQ